MCAPHEFFVAGTLLGYTADGREGLCFLPNGSLVDEWQLYRGDHPCK